jgi:hypothetical protein
MTMVDLRKINLLSDTILYREAKEFVKEFVQERIMPDSRQLTGLATFSRDWNELLTYVKHQAARDWGKRDYYQRFYDDLRKYLHDPKTGLRQRIKTEFTLIAEGLTKREETAALDTWAQALAQEFIQHLVAEARFHQ